MNKITTIALALGLLLAGNAAIAQNDAFYSEVRNYMADNRAEFNKIVTSYLVGQPLSMDEYTMLYYGYTFTDAYKPNYSSNTADSLMNLKKYEEAYKALQGELRRDPTSLQTLFELMNLADVLGKEKESTQYQKNYVNLVKAIFLACGDGLSADNAIRVNHVTDEFQILSAYFKAVSISSKELSPDFVDKVTFKDSSGAVKTVFFDFSRYMVVAD
ncbi:MAG: DUF4919 domain-containing protein [Bacteroidales bacterium]|nr:DUF4919 domain-containing protein [Bacteroidales bacterium]